MTDYAALKLTEMFVRVKPSSQRGGLDALSNIWSLWRSLQSCGVCIPDLARFSHKGDIAITPYRPIRFGSLTGRFGKRYRARVRSYAGVRSVFGAIDARVLRAHARGGRTAMH